MQLILHVFSLEPQEIFARRDRRLQNLHLVTLSHLHCGLLAVAANLATVGHRVAHF